MAGEPDPRPLRVLLVTEASGGGVGRHVLDLAEGLAKRGHEPSVVYSPRRIDPSFHDRRRSLEQAEARVRFHTIPMRRAPHPSDLRAARKLRDLARAEGPFDVVHAQSTKAGILARRRTRLAPRVLYTPHCIYSMNPDAGLAGRVLSIWERWLARRTDTIVGVSPDEAQHLLNHGFDPGRVAYVPNGIETTGFADREESRAALGIAPDWQVVGFVGRLDAQKNPELLLHSFARLAPSLGTARLAVVGSGPLEPSLRELATSLGIQGRVLWLGHRSAREAMPAFDLFALSSRYESFPYVLLEALAAGLPIVATPVGGTRETIVHGENGLIAAAEAEPFGEACLTLLADPRVREDFARESRERAADFELGTMVDRTLALYGRPPQGRRSLLRRPVETVPC